MTTGTGGGGTGGLQMTGLGTLTLPAGSTYTGSTVISGGGTIQITADSALGLPLNPLSFNTGTLQMLAPISSARSIDLVGPGTLLVGASGVSMFSGNITGTGPITIQGSGSAGTVQFLGTNTYTVGTDVFGGATLQISSVSNIGSSSADVVLADLTSNGTLELLEGFSSAVIPNTFVIGASTGTIISDIASGDNVSFSGLISNSGTFVLQQPNASSLTFSNSIIGPVSWLIVEGGNVIFTGSETYNGPTTIAFGTLTVLGTVPNSPIQVDQLGTLQGTGTVQNVNIFGTIAPGNNGIGTIFGTSFTFNPLSTYALEINDTTSDLISATGTVTIIDGMLRLMPTTDFAFPNTSLKYTIIEAGSVVDTVPFILMNPLTRYKFEVFYTPTTVLLGFMGPPTPFHEIIASGRAGEVAKCFDQLFALELSDMRDLINILEMQSPAGIAKELPPDASDQLQQHRLRTRKCR